MRQFKLRNKAGTSSFDFNENKIIITEVSGLGSMYDITIKEGAVTNYQKDKVSISLTLNYGVKGNAYNAYDELAAFMDAHGDEDLVLDYTTNRRTVSADVMLKTMAKSQKTGFGVLTEQLELTRLTNWYTLETINLEMNKPTPISNQSSTPLQLVVIFKAGTLGQQVATARLELKEGPKQISMVWFSHSKYDHEVVINTETKEVIGNGKDNLYTATVNGGGTDSFMIVPKGDYTIITDREQVALKYKKWRAD